MAGRYHRGIRNVNYCLKTGGSISAPFPLNGAVGISFTPQTTPRTIAVRPDKGGQIQHTDFIETGKQASLEILSLPVSFLTDILGYETDENGILYEGAFKSVHFVLLYEEQNEDIPVRHLLYDVVCSKPSFDATTMTNTLGVDKRNLSLVINQDEDHECRYSQSISEADDKALFDSWFHLVR